jgi:hypothetical protein
MVSSFSAKRMSRLSLKEQMRLETMGVPDAPHAGLADACRRHGARAAVRGAGRLMTDRHRHHALHWRSRMMRVRHGRGASLSRAAISTIEKAVPPARCFLPGDAQLLGDLLVQQTIGSPQNNARTLHDAGRQATPSPTRCTTHETPADPLDRRKGSSPGTRDRARSGSVNRPAWRASRGQ